MRLLPESGDTLVIRTDFSAYVRFVDDPQYDGATSAQVRERQP